VPKRLFVLAVCVWLGCAPDHTYERTIVVVGDGPYAYHPDNPYALRFTEIDLTLMNQTAVAHDLVMVDPADGHTIVSVGLVPPGQTASVHFPTPLGTGYTQYPYHCTVPGHTEGGALFVSPAEEKGAK
jgi:hypothetical protein